MASSTSSGPIPKSQVFCAFHNDRERARRISAVIRFAELRLRRRFPLLHRQNLIGTAILVVTLSGMIGSSLLYVWGLTPAWACVVTNTVLASILHELEHDLIHKLYFSRQPVLQNLMIACVWVFQGNTVSPWYRRRIHLLHHKESGNEGDLEVQLLGTGLNYGLLRFITTVDGFLSTCLRGRQYEKIAAYNRWQIALATIPCMMVFMLLWYAWLGFQVVSLTAMLVGSNFSWPIWIESAMPVLNAVAVIYLIPNVLRQATLNIVSSSMHYFGDVEGIVDQTQVLNAWYFWPLQLFCVNFGSTHGIHHFVLSQPFYVRQMVAGLAHKAMRKYGVRFNDLGTFQRANRIHAKI